MLLALGSELLRDCFLHLLGVKAIPLRDTQQHVFRISVAPLIGRIQQANFQKQLAKRGLVIRADLLCQ